MTFADIEYIFNRALRFSFSKKKFLFMFPILVVCGLMLVFCRALAVNAGQWVILSLTFLPIFLSSGLLLAAGVVLARVYHHEVKMIPLSFKKILVQSWELLIGVSYLTLPLLLAYLFLWMVMGIFYLLREIPALGDVLGVVLAFGPFLLVLGSLILSFFNFFLLFFATPHIALNSRLKLKLAEDVYNRFKENIFPSLVLFFFRTRSTSDGSGNFIPCCIFNGHQLSCESRDVNHCPSVVFHYDSLLWFADPRNSFLF